MDCLAQGVKYFTDALSISAYQTVQSKKAEEWMDDPEAAANHMVLGMDLDQRRKARGLNGKKQTPTWI